MQKVKLLVGPVLRPTRPVVTARAFALTEPPVAPARSHNRHICRRLALSSAPTAAAFKPYARRQALFPGPIHLSVNFCRSVSRPIFSGFSVVGPVLLLATDRRLLGDEAPDTLADIGNLALTYSAQGKYGAAEKLQLSALDAQRRVNS